MASECEDLLRQLAARHYPQPREVRDPWAKFWAKVLCLLTALIVGGGLWALAQISLARFVGQ